jgi:hypothetical protein
MPFLQCCRADGVQTWVVCVRARSTAGFTSRVPRICPQRGARRRMATCWRLLCKVCHTMRPFLSYTLRSSCFKPSTCLCGRVCSFSMPSIKLDAWAMRLCVQPLKWFPIDSIMDDDLRPSPRYGHTLTGVSRSEALLVGGAGSSRIGIGFSCLYVKSWWALCPGMTAGSYLADSNDVFFLTIVVRCVSRSASDSSGVAL